MEITYRDGFKEKDLAKFTGISSASVTKLGKNVNVHTEILEKICMALHCDISDIMEISSNRGQNLHGGDNKQ